MRSNLSSLQRKHAPAGTPPTRFLQCARRCFGTFAARVASIWQTTPARALRVASCRREIARNRARGRRSASGQSKPFLLCLRTHVGLGAKEVLGVAPKLARTGARQSNGRGGVFLKCPDRRNKNASRKRTSMAIHIDKTHPSRAERIKCKKGGLLNELNANDSRYNRRNNTPQDVPGLYSPK